MTTLLAAATLLYVGSCSKTTENIGNGLLPEEDAIGVYYTDTLNIICHSEIVDTMATKGLNTILLGSMTDPIMGISTANVFTQLHLSSTHQHFGASPIIDSVVLQLGISGYYGDTTATQTVHVYELADKLDIEKDYYQFSDVNVKPVDLANNYQFKPHPKQKTVVGNDTLLQPVIRIPLLNSFGEQLAMADTSAYSSVTAFKNFMYGLKICCEEVTQGGAISYLLPISNSITKLELYYHESDTSVGIRYDYYITSEDCYFNQYLHDYSLGSPGFVQQVLQGDTALGQQKLYLQSMGGVRSLLRFPYIQTWGDTLRDAHLVINEAKLLLPVSQAAEDSIGYAPISSLALLSINSDGSTSLLPDYFEGNAYYGGTYSSTTKSVLFRITEYLQDLVNGKNTSNGLYLSITGAAFNASRSVIVGPESAANQTLKCQVKYSIVGE